MAKRVYNVGNAGLELCSEILAVTFWARLTRMTGLPSLLFIRHVLHGQQKEKGSSVPYSPRTSLCQEFRQTLTAVSDPTSPKLPCQHYDFML